MTWLYWIKSKFINAIYLTLVLLLISNSALALDLDLVKSEVAKAPTAEAKLQRIHSAFGLEASDAFRSTMPLQIQQLGDYLAKFCKGQSAECVAKAGAWVPFLCLPLPQSELPFVERWFTGVGSFNNQNYWSAVLTSVQKCGEQKPGMATMLAALVLRVSLDFKYKNLIDSSIKLIEEDSKSASAYAFTAVSKLGSHRSMDYSQRIKFLEMGEAFLNKMKEVSWEKADLARNLIFDNLFIGLRPSRAISIFEFITPQLGSMELSTVKQLVDAYCISRKINHSVNACVSAAEKYKGKSEGRWIERVRLEAAIDLGKLDVAQRIIEKPGFAPNPAETKFDSDDVWIAFNVSRYYRFKGEPQKGKAFLQSFGAGSLKQDYAFPYFLEISKLERALGNLKASDDALAQALKFNDATYAADSFIDLVLRVEQMKNAAARKDAKDLARYKQEILSYVNRDPLFTAYVPLANAIERLDGKQEVDPALYPSERMELVAIQKALSSKAN